MSSALERTALISIGTNSTRLLILNGHFVAVAKSVGTRLGRGLGPDGKLDSSAAERTLTTIREYVEIIRTHAATLDVIATSALRRADDAVAFSRAVEAIAGVAPYIISGDQEAAYSFAGATSASAGGDRFAVLDVGGGSTELAVGRRDAIERTVSLEIGAVRLAERFPALLGASPLDVPTRMSLVTQARRYVDMVLAPLAGFASFDELIAVGGTVFTAAGMFAHDPSRDGVRLDRLHRRSLIDDLLARNVDARRIMAHIRPQRADILPAGLIVVDVACDRLGVDTLRVSHADLLAGYLHSAEYRAHSLTPIAATG